MIVDDDYIYKYWFPKGYSGEICIVGQRDPARSYDSNAWSDQYAYIDNFGDKDLFFLVYGFVCRYYPKADIKYYYSENYIAEHRNNWKTHNLIVIGGPSSKHRVARYYMHDVLSRINFKLYGINMPPIMYTIKNTNAWLESKASICGLCSEHDENYHCDSNRAFCIWKSSSPNKPIRELDSESIKRDNKREIPRNNVRRIIKDIKTNGDSSRLVQDADNDYWMTNCISQDVCFFAAFQNPDNESNRIILINGLHTLGGVGAFKSFDLSDNDTCNVALDNYRLIDSVLGGLGIDFVSYFSVKIDEQAYILNQCTRLSEHNLITLCSGLSEPIANYGDIQDLKAKLSDLKCQIQPFLELYDQPTSTDVKLQNMGISIIQKIDKIWNQLHSSMKISEYKKCYSQYTELCNLWKATKQN